MRNRLVLLLVVGVLVFCTPLFAQVSTKYGAIFGKTVDDKGAPLPGVTVTLESTIMPAKTATTGASGAFRFPNLSVGTYSVTSSIEGFAEVRQEDVRVNVGSEVQLTMVMKPVLTEVTTVIAETPAIDTKKIGTSTTFNRESLENVPSARDPWSLMEAATGVDTDRFNVGGSESGQQDVFSARGANPANNNWNFEGVTITDPGAAGASTYYDFDAFEEVNLLTGGADSSIGTSGIQVNLVLKRGTNNYAGNASFFFADDALTGTNTPEALAALGITKVVNIKQIEDYGADLGGPIVKDKLFAWGAYRKNDIQLTKISLAADHIILKSTDMKVNFTESQAHESSFVYFNNDKIRNNRAAVSTTAQSEASLWEQGGSITATPGFFSGQHTWIPDDHTIFTGRVAYNLIGFTLIPHGGKEVQMLYFGLPAEKNYQQTFGFIAPIDRPSWDVNMDLNEFKENMWGGDHEFKFGFEWRTNKIHTFYSYGNGVLASDYNQTDPYGPLLGGYNPDYRSGTESYVNIRRDINGTEHTKSTGFYAQDTYRRGKMTLNLGVNFTHQSATNDPSTAGVTAGFESLLAPVLFPGNDFPVNFNNFAPRFGATYDITGDGKTVARGSFSRYYDGMGVGFPSFINPTGIYNGFTATFTNTDGDRNVELDELTSTPSYYGGIDGAAFDLAGFAAKHIVDPNLKNSFSNEYIAGFEREVWKNMTVSVDYTHRDYHNTTAILPFGVTSDQFVQIGTIEKDTPVGHFSIPEYQLTYTQDGRQILTNIKDYVQVYNGVDLRVNKRMSDNFQLNGSFTYQKQHADYNGGDSAAFIVQNASAISATGTVFPFDPTNVLFNDGQTYAYVSSGSGKTGPYPFSEWNFKVNGVYQLPYEISIGGSMRYQQGFPWVIFGSFTDLTLADALGTSTHVVQAEPFGSRRFDNVFLLDLQFQKTFNTGKYGRFAVSADVFNITNANTVTLRGRNIGSSSFGRVTGISEYLAPRSLRLGIRYTF